MSDDLLVKICGITSEADALLAVGLGADAVGFVLAPSPRQIAPAAAADIVKRLPHDVLTVGVFRDEAASRVVEITNSVGFGAVQLHGHETAGACRWIRERVACTIKAFPAGDRTVSRFGEFGADYLMIDGKSPGSGAVFDWRLAEGVADPRRMFVSGGLDPDNVAEAVARLNPRGVDVASGVESSPGRKDPRKLREFIVNARLAATRPSVDGSPMEAAAPMGEWTGAVSPYEDPHAEAAAPYDWMEG